MTDPRNVVLIDAYTPSLPSPLPDTAMTPEMERILRAARTSKPVIGWRELSRQIGYSAVTIRFWAIKLGLNWQSLPSNSGGRGHKGSADWAALDDRLRQLWAEGLTARVIGERLGLTKSAVIGRAHRLKLASRASPVVPRPPGQKPAKKRNRSKVTLRSIQREIDGPLEIKARLPGYGALKRTLRVEPVAEKPAPLPIPPRQGPVRDCAWPMWGKERPGLKPLFCGTPSAPGRPYCGAHCERAYVVRERRVDGI